MSREIKFRVWHEKVKIMSNELTVKDLQLPGIKVDKYGIWMQYTGLKDKNGVEIYEFMEIDNSYEVNFIDGSYVLTNISNSDIILLSKYIGGKNGKIEITKEYSKI